jgi:hypothetical protein
VVECPDFEVTKECAEPGRLYEDGEIATYDIVVTNTGDVELFLEITDLDAVPQIIDDLVGPVAPGGTYTITIEIPVVCSDQDPVDVPILIPNTVSVIAIDPAGNEYGPETADADCAYICRRVGSEGCTPGFWKNHTDCWCNDVYPPSMDVDDVWNALKDPNYVALDDSKWTPATDTLNESIRYRGGGGLAGAARNMLRHATAALQNACVSDVAYPASVATIISEVNRVLATEDPAEIQALHTILADWNENSPCPINAHCDVKDVDDD